MSLLKVDRTWRWLALFGEKVLPPSRWKSSGGISDTFRKRLKNLPGRPIKYFSFFFLNKNHTFVLLDVFLCDLSICMYT